MNESSHNMKGNMNAQSEVTYTLDSLAELDNRAKFPQSVRSLVWRIWCEDKNTWCILTDHAFTESEARETLDALEANR